MVSMVETGSRSDRNDAAMESLVPKSEPVPDGSISSTVSTPDAEVEPLTQDTTQTQKRKGGRKPVSRAVCLDIIPRHWKPFSFFSPIPLSLTPSELLLAAPSM